MQQNPQLRISSNRKYVNFNWVWMVSLSLEESSWLWLNLAEFVWVWLSLLSLTVVGFSWVGLDKVELNWSLDEYGWIRNIWLTFAQLTEFGLSWAELDRVALSLTSSAQFSGDRLVRCEFGGISQVGLSSADFCWTRIAEFSEFTIPQAARKALFDREHRNNFKRKRSPWYKLHALYTL